MTAALDPRVVLALWSALMKWPVPPPGFPAGPEPLPAIGSKVLFTSTNRAETLRALGQQRGDVVGFYVPPKFRVYLQDQQLVRNVSRDPDMAVRPQVAWPVEAFFTDEQGVRRGVHLGTGQVWTRNRRIVDDFLSKAMVTPEFAAVVKGRVDMHASVMNKYPQYKTTKVDVTTYMGLVIHTFWALITGTPIGPDQMFDLQQMYTMIGDFGKIRSSPLAQFPLPQILPDVTGYTKIKKMRTDTWQMFQRYVPASSSKPNSVKPNLFSAYQAATGAANDWKNDQNFKTMVMELLAPTVTLSLALGWAVLYLVAFPTFQSIIAAEVSNVLGKQQAPTHQDMDRMPKMLAFVEESLRMSSPARFSTGIMSNQNKTLGTYDLPAQTPILYGLYAMNQDSNTWPNPESFDISRHIGSDGRYQRDPNVASFSFGRRRCAGHEVARAIMFHTLSRYLQKFELQAVGGSAPSTVSIENGANSVFQPFTLRYVDRQ